MEFNSTLLMQAGIYLVLFFILKKLYFEPLLALLARREAMTTGKIEETEELSKKVAALRQSYQQQIQDFRFKLNQEREARLQKIKSDLSERVSDTQKSLAENHKRHHEVLDAEVRAVMSRFSVLSDDLRDEIVRVIESPRIKAI